MNSDVFSNSVSALQLRQATKTCRGLFDVCASLAARAGIEEKPSEDEEEDDGGEEGDDDGDDIDAVSVEE